jgi:hypothetical protein
MLALGKLGNIDNGTLTQTIYTPTEKKQSPAVYLNYQKLIFAI